MNENRHKRKHKQGQEGTSRYSESAGIESRKVVERKQNRLNQTNILSAVDRDDLEEQILNVIR